MQTNQNGMILLVTLIWMLTLMPLVLAGLESNLYHHKTVAAIHHEMVAFQAAESGLKVAEALIQANEIPLPDTGARVNYQIRLINQDACQQKRYRITSSAQYANINIILESEFLYLKNTAVTKCQKEVIQKRVWWEER